MAIFHLSIKITGRGKGKSAVAAAAYRTGEKIKNEYDGMVHDYTRKQGIVHSEILLPDNAPLEYKDRTILWNAVEKVEKFKTAQLARDIEIALPIELTLIQNKSLVREYVKKNFAAAGMCADIAIHDSGDGNPHAHVLLTMRPFNEDGTWGNKQKKEYILDAHGSKIYDPLKRQYKCQSVPSTDWNEQTKAEEWRAAWAETANKYLAHLNHAERIDYRSYERQGITDQVPTIHLGTAASQMEKRGIRTERGYINREIELTNQKLQNIKARLTKLQTWLKEESENTEPLSLADIVSNILNRRGQTGQQSRHIGIYNLKAVADMLNFLTENKIMDIAGLDEKLSSMIDKQFKLRDKLKPVDRRLKVLDGHIKQAEIYREHTNINRLYQQQNPKDKDDFYETHRADLTLYHASERYLKAHLNGRDKIPLSAWEVEREKLDAEKKRLSGEYITLKNNTTKVEKIRSNVYNIMRSESREPQRKMTHGLEH